MRCFFPRAVLNDKFYWSLGAMFFVRNEPGEVAFWIGRCECVLGDAKSSLRQLTLMSFYLTMVVRVSLLKPLMLQAKRYS